MKHHYFRHIIFASAAAFAVGCAGQSGGSESTESEVDLSEQVCSTKSSDCPVICAKSGLGECQDDPIDPCLKESGGCEPVDPCPKHYGEECPPPPPPPPPPAEGCTLTQGYWKNHPEAWPVDGLTIDGETYLQGVLLAILETPVEGNAALNLLHQYIAAALNLAAGADDSDVADAFNDAHDWFVAYLSITFVDGMPVVGHVDSSSPEGQIAIALAGILDQFNNGFIGPGHCDDVVTAE
jgi:hypothetical protein